MVERVKTRGETSVTSFEEWIEMLDFEVKSASELSSLGDGFVNFIYSLALSNALKKPTGKKVSNYILAEALIRSGLRERAGKRLRKHEMADYVECAVFDAWVRKTITLEECVYMLTKNLRSKGENFKLREASIDAFAELLKHVDRVKK
ncbi:MAG: ribonuclease III family protein [Candidatus Hydrothermarchaeota archaeon]|nr:ribonuclease III family protein [Candidatus Hydrothermarchaeota archaeon]